jgi:hypothetical protein
MLHSNFDTSWNGARGYAVENSNIGARREEEEEEEEEEAAASHPLPALTSQVHN